MSSTLQYLCNELRSTIEREDTKLRKAEPTDKRVAITLWFLATGTIAHLFGVSKSAVSLVVRDVSSAILQLLPRYIRFPTGDALRRLLMALRENMGFHSVQLLLMKLIFLLFLRLNAQPTTTTVRGGIPLFYKVQLTTKAVSLTSM